jgi:hypothetical protein
MESKCVSQGCGEEVLYIDFASGHLICQNHLQQHIDTEQPHAIHSLLDPEELNMWYTVWA